MRDDRDCDRGSSPAIREGLAPVPSILETAAKPFLTVGLLPRLEKELHKLEQGSHDNYDKYSQRDEPVQRRNKGK